MTLAAIFGIAACGAAIAQAPPAERRSVWDGVYTEAQANRGRKEYERACERCHKSNLGGDPVEEVPALVWDAFIVQWSGRTAKDLVERISKSMPPDEPGSLARRAYVDIVSYILQANSFPVGSRPLDRDAAQLERIVIEKAPKENGK